MPKVKWDFSGSTSSRCVILGRGAAIDPLRGLLGSFFEECQTIETKEAFCECPASAPVALLLVTGTFPGGIDYSLLLAAKAKFRPSSTICIIAHMDPRAEIRLRSTGLAFLGSHVAFASQGRMVLDLLPP